MQKLTHFIHRNKILLLPFQNLHKILLYVDVDRAVAGEGTAGLLIKWVRIFFIAVSIIPFSNTHI